VVSRESAARFEGGHTHFDIREGGVHFVDQVADIPLQHSNVGAISLDFVNQPMDIGAVLADCCLENLNLISCLSSVFLNLPIKARVNGLNCLDRSSILGANILKDHLPG
jgi:hypothetical protein